MVFAGEVTIFPGEVPPTKQGPIFQNRNIYTRIIRFILPWNFTESHPFTNSLGRDRDPMGFRPTSQLGHWYCTSADRRFPIGISRFKPTDIVGDDTPQVEKFWQTHHQLHIKNPVDHGYNPNILELAKL